MREPVDVLNLEKTADCLADGHGRQLTMALRDTRDHIQTSYSFNVRTQTWDLHMSTTHLSHQAREANTCTKLKLITSHG